MQAEYPQTIDYIVYTVDGRLLQWPAFDYDSLIKSLHFYGHTAKKIITLEEYQELQDEMEMAKEFLRKEEVA